MSLPILPEDITYLTELDKGYANDLKRVTNGDDFDAFLVKYMYWLDEETKSLTGDDYERLRPLIKDCRNEGVIQGDQHNEALALLMPTKILMVSLVKNKYSGKVCWGLVYLRMKKTWVLPF